MDRVRLETSSLDALTSSSSQVTFSAKHVRVERSASPILNDIPTSGGTKLAFEKSHHNQGTFNDFHGAPAAVGRYHNVIQPTSTLDKPSRFEETLNDSDRTKVPRMGKDLNEGESFLVKGDLRPFPAGSPTLPSSTIIATPTMPIAMSTWRTSHRPRQNSNPDIQDIITGIVKLLNGNVNVHANTSPSRRPISTRINNRGPPRISEAQSVADFEQQQQQQHQLSSTVRPPPPYPFDRPESPVRPFLTGVPLPEQVVPQMQQNYRPPGFISQNRLPWQRPRPRPPITGNGNTRRPIPMLIPTMQTGTGPDESQTTGADPHLDQNTYEVEEEPNEAAQRVGTGRDPPRLDTTSKDESHINVDKLTKENRTISPSVDDGIEPSASGQSVDTLLLEINSMSSIDGSVTETTESVIANATDHLPNLEPSITDATPMHNVTVNGFKSSTPSLDLVSSSFTTITTSANEHKILSSNVLDTYNSKDTKLIKPSLSKPIPSPSGYHPRPGIVLDDPEFKPGGHSRPVRPQRPALQPSQPARPPGYGEIFDITLSAIQGPTGGGSGVQTVNIKPHGGNKYQDDIIVSPSGDEGFVSIDGKRTYINLFGEQTDGPQIQPSTTAPQVQPTQSKPHYGIIETETIKPPPQAAVLAQAPQQSPHRPLYRPRPPPNQNQAPPPRIDTCIVGDDSTCDQTQNERCRTEASVSSCHCRPGYARRNDRDPCRRIVSLSMSLRVDKLNDRRVGWDQRLAQSTSEPYVQLSYEAVRAVDSAMSMTPFSDDFMEAKVNRIYNGDASRGEAGVFVNLTLKLVENAESLRPTLKNDIQRHLLGVIHRRNNNIGNSALYVESPAGSVTNLQDVDECTSADLNDCHAEAVCTNIWGSFRCECQMGYRDPWSDQAQRAGRDCQTCSDTHCNGRGTCSFDKGKEVCACLGNYYGAQCEIDGEVLGVAIGASVAAVIIIVLTLVCLVMWSRRWQREQKQLGSPVFGYMTTAGQQVKSPVMAQAPYQVTLEDRMRWAQIADVMAQANHYAAEPVGTSTRAGSTLFGYPNLQAMSQMGTLSMSGTLPMHSGTLPPVPMPR